MEVPGNPHILLAPVRFTLLVVASHNAQVVLIELLLTHRVSLYELLGYWLACISN